MSGYRTALKDYLLADSALSALTGPRIYLLDELGIDGVSSRLLNSPDGVMLTVSINFRMRQQVERYEHNRMVDLHVYDDMDNKFSNIELALLEIWRLLNYRALRWKDGTRSGTITTFSVMDAVQLYERDLRAAKSVSTFKLIEQERN